MGRNGILGLALITPLITPAAIAAQGASDETCDILDSMAEVTMTSRQAGMPMIEQYKLAAKQPPEVAGPAKMIIEAAYKLPRQESAQARAQAVTDFRDQFFQGCLSTRQGKTP